MPRPHILLRVKVRSLENLVPIAFPVFEILDKTGLLMILENPVFIPRQWLSKIRLENVPVKEMFCGSFLVLSSLPCLMGCCLVFSIQVYLLLYYRKDCLLTDTLVFFKNFWELQVILQERLQTTLRSNSVVVKLNYLVFNDGSIIHRY